MAWLFGNSAALGDVAAKASDVRHGAGGVASGRAADARAVDAHRLCHCGGHGSDHRTDRDRRRELRKCALTENDLFTQLRQQGVFSLEDVRHVLYESKGSVTIVGDRSVAIRRLSLSKPGLTRDRVPVTAAGVHQFALDVGRRATHDETALRGSGAERALPC